MCMHKLVMVNAHVSILPMPHSFYGIYMHRVHSAFEFLLPVPPAVLHQSFSLTFYGQATSTDPRITIAFIRAAFTRQIRGSRGSCSICKDRKVTSEQTR